MKRFANRAIGPHEHRRKLDDFLRVGVDGFITGGFKIDHHVGTWFV